MLTGGNIFREQTGHFIMHCWEANWTAALSVISCALFLDSSSPQNGLLVIQQNVTDKVKLIILFPLVLILSWPHPICNTPYISAFCASLSLASCILCHICFHWNYTGHTLLDVPVISKSVSSSPVLPSLCSRFWGKDHMSSTGSMSGYD